MLEWRRGRKRLRPQRSGTRDVYDLDRDRLTRLRRYDRSPARDYDYGEGGLINWRRTLWQTVAAASVFLLIVGLSRTQWGVAKTVMAGVRYSVVGDFDWRGLYDRVQAIAVWHPLGGSTVNPAAGGGDTNSGASGTAPGASGTSAGSGTGAAALKIKLTPPLRGTVTLPYGLYNHGNEQRFHTGIDIDAKEGDPIVAAGDGAVVAVARNATYGLYVEIDHGGGVVTLYAHCSQVVVKPKDAVKAGQTIAKAGRTGNATGAHLHFEVQLNGQTVDPAPLIGAR